MGKALVLFALIAWAGVPAAFAAGHGTSMLSIGISQGTGDYGFELRDDVGNPLGYVEVFSNPEVGVTGEYWYMFADDYAFALQGSFSFFSENQKPGTNAFGTAEIKTSTTSFKVRVGGDRVGSIGDRFTWFMGPGVEFWSGKGKIEVDSLKEETESTTRFGINGRFGGVMKLSDAVGFQGQIGHTLGYASVEENGAKTTWWPSSFNAGWGIIFTFGGK